MFIGNFLKYTQNEKLKKLLLDTGDTLLVEASPYDKRWGIGLRADSIAAKHPKYWEGTNWLGEVLTKVREQIKLKQERYYLW